MPNGFKYKGPTPAGSDDMFGRGYGDSRYWIGDIAIGAFAPITTRAVGLGDGVMGQRLLRATTFTAVYYRCYTADASGNLVVGLRKNGSAISGTSATIAAANQVAGAQVTGSWACAAGDIITVYVTGIGTAPGKGLVADLTGILT